MSQERQEKELIHLYCGLDLGKRQDYSALVILEYRRRWALVRNPVNYGMDVVDEEVRHAIRLAKRIPLGTKYLDVVHAVDGLLKKATKKWDCTLVLDATGVGQPVVEMFETMPFRATMVPVVITAGSAGGETKTKDEWRVPKQDLISGLQVMLESEELVIAKDMELGQALLEEMVEMRADGQGGGAHDDLVMALALAVWRARRFAPQVNPDGTAKRPRAGFRSEDPGLYGVGSSPWGWRK